MEIPRLIPRSSEPKSLTPKEKPLNDWLKENFKGDGERPNGKRHQRVYEWFESLQPGGDPPTPRVEIWPRGGGKSTTVERGVCRIATKSVLTRNFCLIVCATQEQADAHVQAIATILEEQGVDRKLNKHGNSRGWRRNQLRTADGFNVAALGLDTASRGIKFDEFRPDLIVFDDIDSEEDTPKTVKKKIQRITKKIIPAGAPNKAILFVQNLIHEDSIVNQLYEGRATFLHNRDIPDPEVAVEGLQVGQDRNSSGRMVYKIIAGKPTWEGQDLFACEQQINDQGYEEFLRESQHEIAATEGYIFNDKAVNIIEAREVPQGLRMIRAWDFASTHGGGDYTVGVLMGYHKESTAMYVLNVVRGQWSPDEVESHVRATADSDFDIYGVRTIRLTDDPGSAGTIVVNHFKTKVLANYNVIAKSATGHKAERARPWAKHWNSGNVYLVEADWNFEYTREHRKFREDLEHEHDDQVDPSADAFNELSGGSQRVQAFTAKW